jgi:hypothetical protein
MAFSPNEFISTMRSFGGPAKSSLYAVVIPIPYYINNFVTYDILDAIQNRGRELVNSFVDPITSFINSSLGRGPIDDQSRTSSTELSRTLGLLCEAAELPGKNIRSHDARVYGPGYKVPYLTSYGNDGDITLTFLCTNQFQERALFERWMEAIIPSDTFNPRFPKSEKSRYMTNIRLIKYDEQANQVFVIELVDAFPIAIAPQALSWSDEGFMRLGVQMSYRYYKVVFQGGFNPSQENLTNFGLRP